MNVLRSKRLTGALVLLTLILAGRDAIALTASERRGRALANRLCVQCHAIGRSGASPHIGAPPFRQLDNRVDLATFEQRLRRGLMSSHPDMPAYRFTREDAHAFIAYLRAIQGP